MYHILLLLHVVVISVINHETWTIDGAMFLEPFGMLVFGFEAISLSFAVGFEALHT